MLPLHFLAMWSFNVANNLEARFAYDMPTYKEAKTALDALTLAFFIQGLEETLTLHRLTDAQVEAVLPYD